MSTVDVSGVASFLAHEIGLEPEVLGERNLAAAVSARAAALGLASEADYGARLAASSAERTALIEEVVVPETWFFREPAAFEALAAYARERAARGARGALPAPSALPPLRVLCVPCATGEEAASIAMTLLDAGLAPADFVVDARDVSARNIARAEQGIFGRRAVRTGAVPEQHCVPGGAGAVELSPRVRATLRFSVDNAASPGFLAEPTPFDAIFCRNLLIYLTRPARERCLQAMARALVPGGLLFTGHAEAVNLLDPRWVPAGPGEAFAFKLRGPAPAPLEAPKPAVPPLGPRRATLPTLTHTLARTPEEHITPGGEMREPAGTHTDPVLANRVALAASLADRGELEAARALCEDALREGAEGAPLRHLLGVIHLAMGAHDEAERSLVRATLIDPAHVPSLLQLSAYFRRRGNTARAAGYRRRAHEAQQREQSQAQSQTQPQPQRQPQRGRA